MLNRFSKLFVLGMFLFTGLANASDDLIISEAWIPQAPPVAKVMAGYMQVKNPTQKDITIISVSSPVFNSIEMHETVHEDGVAKMIRQEKLVIPAGQTRSFQRGGLHLMMFKPKQPLKLDDAIQLELKTSSGNISYTARVKVAELEDHSHHHHH